MQPWRSVPSRAIIVGAGLAGACVAFELSRRGWQVQVLDAAPAPASGASGLPAGLVVPHVSPDDNYLAQVTRAGARYTWQLVRELLVQGQDFAQTGVTERQFDRASGATQDNRWHPDAGWIKPARLVQALLAQQGIEWLGQTGIRALRRQDSLWHALDAGGHSQASAPLMVLCAGFDTHALSGHSFPLQALRGQVSWGLHDGANGHMACDDGSVNGAGNLVPHVPTELGQAWYVGSTFDRDDIDTRPRHADHQANFDRLQRLSPDFAQAVKNQFDNNLVRAFSAIRCAARDRMPVVGPIDPDARPGLWVSTAMGARGLTLAALCAHLLACELHGEQPVIGPKLAAAMGTRRKSLGKSMHSVRSPLLSPAP